MFRIPLLMSRHMDFVGQRADKFTVKDTAVRNNQVVKHVEYYTMTCGECDGTGYYNYKGEVICDGCGLVLSGDRQATISTEYSEGRDNDSMGRGRGMGVLDEARGSHRPSI